MAKIVGYSTELLNGEAKILCPICCREFFIQDRDPIHADDILPSPVGCVNCGRLLRTNLTDEGEETARKLLNSFVEDPGRSSVNQRFCRHLYQQVIA